MAKLVRKTPSLKSQGAKYSVTNRKGETSYYASSKDVDAGKAPVSKSGGKESPADTLGRAQAMVAQTQAEGSKPFAGSTYEKNYLAGIPAVSSQEGPINIPPPPTTNIGTTVDAGNAGLASVLGGMATFDGSKFIPTPTQPTDNFQSLFEQATALDKKAFDEMGTGEERMRRLEREADLRQKEAQVTDLTSSLNQIVAERDANILRVEGQGRGIPDVIIGGQQAQINKEAAIKALPVQAQLAAAQGALELAQNHVDKMFQIQSNDALARYQYKSKLIDSVYNFATAQEQRRLDAIKQKEDRAYDMQKTNIAMQNDWAKTALEYGQSNLVGQIMKLDPNSPTFSSDLATLQGRVQKPVTGGTTSTQDWDFKDIGGVLYKVNKRTGEIIAGDTPVAGGQSTENLEAKYSELLKDIGDATTLANSGAVGAGSLERKVKGIFTSNADFAQVQNIADTIKSNLLTLNTDPNIKKFFGPQMSNRDTELMMGAAGTLNPDKQTPEQFKRDLQDAAQLIARARTAVQQGVQKSPFAFTIGEGSQSVLPMNVITAPNGMEIEIID